MVSQRKFYRTVFTVEVLSETEIPAEMELDDVLQEADTGDFVATSSRTISEERTASQMVKLLLEAGSEPEFFYLHEDGSDAADL